MSNTPLNFTSRKSISLITIKSAQPFIITTHLGAAGADAAVASTFHSIEWYTVAVAYIVSVTVGRTRKFTLCMSDCLSLSLSPVRILSLSPSYTYSHTKQWHLQYQSESALGENKNARCAIFSRYRLVCIFIYHYSLPFAPVQRERPTAILTP